MKKFILMLMFIFLVSAHAFAASSKVSKVTAYEIKEIKNFLVDYAKLENQKDIASIKNLHTDDYITVDAIPKNIYLKIVAKTWDKYPSMKVDLKFKNIQVNGIYATAEVEETLEGKTFERIEDKTVEGILKSSSNVIYYLRKDGLNWKLLSDYVIDEQTVLNFEKAKDLNVSFIAPQRILAGKEYTTTLNVQSIPKDSFVIATIGQEKIIYPHKNAEEVYRKVPQDGILERIFISNQNNLNEYVVATYCITKPILTKDKQVETLLTGVGYIINRVNVVPENKFITMDDDNAKIKNETKK